MIDFSRYVPTVLSSLVAKFRANANTFFPKAYGVSLTEWRILSFLREHEPTSAYDIWTRSDLDKAVVSRDTNSLRDKGLIKLTPVKSSSRNRSEIRLTSAGKTLLDRSIDEVLRRHDNLTAGLDGESMRSFFRVMEHLERRIAHMADDSAAHSRSPHSPIKRVTSKPRD
ncbi:MarR family winged helix-turn-helix transcriptional regulator [Bradyrhizobium sp. DOA9]|uniref:MarR family winged helix-turn-helix transcriptional regulator n=1 Tax=Bradyrhizobium sp. DOA9 TaxID=1126627 RepID=UPI0004998D1D|nr:MarR family winged helix-turn-helix transcriptional regulator [Bradyrhizobium sp. DOA9]GAJ37980.1 transcriptional regulators [Bradyrhizobium sp. DOA9]